MNVYRFLVALGLCIIAAVSVMAVGCVVYAVFTVPDALFPAPYKLIILMIVGSFLLVMGKIAELHK